MKRKTTEQFIKELNIKFPNKFDTTEAIYINNKTNVILKCNDCGYKKGYRPDTILKASTVRGCYNCELINKRKRNEEKSITKEEAISRAIKLYGNKYDYSKVEYVSYNSKVKIYCNTCKSYFLQSFYVHNQGHECSKCCGRQRTKEEAIQIIEELYPNIYDFSEFSYNNATDKFVLICKKHNYKININFHKLISNSKNRKCCPKEWQSSANLYIKNLLDKNNIKNIPEYIFNDCKNINNLPFDSYLPDYNCVIEFQGIFHYKDIYGELNIQKKRDKIKRDYCLAHNIKEIEIPYWEYDNISTIISNELNVKLNL